MQEQQILALEALYQREQKILVEVQKKSEVKELKGALFRKLVHDLGLPQNYLKEKNEDDSSNSSSDELSERSYNLDTTGHRSRVMTNQSSQHDSLTIDGGNRLMSMVKSNFMKKQRVKRKCNDNDDLLLINKSCIKRKEVKNRAVDMLFEVMTRKMIHLKETPAQLVTRLMEKKINEASKQGLLLTQAATTVQIKILSSELDDDEGILYEAPLLDATRETEFAPAPAVDTTMYTRTFRVGLRTQVSELLNCATEFWGLQDGLSVLYIVEEDGSLRDLQYDLNSSVIKVVEQYHT